MCIPLPSEQWHIFFLIPIGEITDSLSISGTSAILCEVPAEGGSLGVLARLLTV